MRNDTENFDIIPQNNLKTQMKISLALNSRKISLVDDIEEDSIYECIYFLNKLKRLDNITKTKEPIEILVNTYGGAVEEGLVLVSLIEQMKDEGYKIITTNIGKAYSMGFIISICGSERRAYRYSRYMYHDVALGCYGKYQECKQRLEETDILRSYIKEIVCKYTSISEKDIEEINSRKDDIYYTVNKMKELKGVDIIL